MDRCEQEVVRTHHRHKLRSLRKILLHYIHLSSDLLIHSRCIGTCHLEYHEHNGRFTVHLTLETIGKCTQFHVSHLFQTEHRTVALRTDNRVPKFIHTLQTSAILHRELENIHRVLTQRTCRRFDILFTEHGCYIRWNQPVLGHQFRFQPDTHTIGIAQLHDVAHAFYTFDLRNHINVQIIGKECLVIITIRTDKRVDLQETGLTLLGSHTDLGHFGW